MFWDSVVAGLTVLTYWQTYVAGLEYLAIYIIPMFILGRFVGKSEPGKGLRYISQLLIPIMQVTALVVFILTLSTIIFGFTTEASWGFPWSVMTMAPAAFFILVGALIIVSFVLSLIPVLGRFHSLHTLVLGGLALIFVLSTFDSVSPDNANVDVNFIPGLWFLLGLVAMGGMTSWVGTFVSSRLVAAIKFGDDRVGQFIMIPISAIFGFIPLFMYGAWLGAQVRGGF